MSLFNFDWVPEEELVPKAVLLSPGEASFVVKKYYDRDKMGNWMMTQNGQRKFSLELLVHDCKGEKGIIFEGITSKMPWKLKGLCDAIGKGTLYNRSGEIDLSQLLGGMGKCILKNEQNPGYNERTVVEKYIKAGDSGNSRQQEFKQQDEDDDLPF